MRLLIFGDSITEGFEDSEMGGWVNRLKIELFEKGIDTTNCGIQGYTTSDTLKIFDAFYEGYTCKQTDKETAVVFFLGTNDICFSNGKNQVELKNFQENIEQLYNLAKKKLYTTNIYFFTALNFDEAKTNPNPWGFVYRDSYIQKYNQTIKDFCISKGIEYLDLYGLLDNTDFSDGLHPNAEGHKKIYKKVYEFLNNNI